MNRQPRATAKGSQLKNTSTSKQRGDDDTIKLKVVGFLALFCDGRGRLYADVLRLSNAEGG